MNPQKGAHCVYCSSSSSSSSSSWNCPIVVCCDALLPSRCLLSSRNALMLSRNALSSRNALMSSHNQCSNVIRICKPIRKQESVNVTCCKFKAIFEAAVKKMDGLWDKYYNFIV